MASPGSAVGAFFGDDEPIVIGRHADRRKRFITARKSGPCRSVNIPKPGPVFQRFRPQLVRQLERRRQARATNRGVKPTGMGFQVQRLTDGSVHRGSRGRTDTILCEVCEQRRRWNQRSVLCQVRFDGRMVRAGAQPAFDNRPPMVEPFLGIRGKPQVGDPLHVKSVALDTQLFHIQRVELSVNLVRQIARRHIRDPGGDCELGENRLSVNSTVGR